MAVVVLLVTAESMRVEGSSPLNTFVDSENLQRLVNGNIVELFEPRKCLELCFGRRTTGVGLDTAHIQ